MELHSAKLSSFPDRKEKDMVDLVKLNTEIDTDPLGRGYVGMTLQQAADDLNDDTQRSRNRTSMTGDEVFAAIESQAVWDALTDAQRLEFLSLCGRDTLDPFSTANVALVTSIFGASVTLTNLQNARVESVSRATELGIGTVSAGHVEYVRNN